MAVNIRERESRHLILVTVLYFQNKIMKEMEKEGV